MNQCHDHPWRYVQHDDADRADERWCPVCGCEEYSFDGDLWEPSPRIYGGI